MTIGKLVLVTAILFAVLAPIGAAQAAPAKVLYTKEFADNDGCRDGIFSAVVAGGPRWINDATEVDVKGYDFGVTVHVYNDFGVKKVFVFTCLRGQLKLHVAR